MKTFIITESQLDTIIKGVINEKKTSKYGPEHIEKILRQYDGRFLSDFQKEQSGLSSYLHSKGKDVYNELTKNMIRKNEYIPDDELRKEAQKYERKTGENSFKEMSPKHYQQSQRRGPFKVDPNTGKKYNTLGFYNDITKHMKAGGSLTKRLVYVHEFREQDGSPVAAYVGLTYSGEKRLQQHLTGKNTIGSTKETPVTRFIRDNPQLKHEYKELTGYMDSSEASREEREWEQKYREDGWDILNQAKTGNLGSTIKKSDEELKRAIQSVEEEGLTLNQARIKYPDLIARIYQRKLDLPPYNYLDNLERKRSKSKTDETLYDIATSYDSYSDMFNKDKKTYRLIYKRGLLQKVQDFYKQKESDDTFTDDGENL